MALQIPETLLIANYPISHSLGYDFLCQIVLGRTESARGYYHVAVVESEMYQLFKAFRIVSHAVMIHHVYAQVVKLLGKPRCVGIDDLSEEDFSSHCKQCCFHMSFLRHVKFHMASRPGSSYDIILSKRLVCFSRHIPRRNKPSL